MKTKIIVVGFKGKMGRALLACALAHPNIEVVGQIDVGDYIRSVIANCDIVVNFSLHTTTPALARLCAKNSKGLVIGTTGHTDEERSEIAKSSKTMPIVMASNFSTGVNALFWIALNSFFWSSAVGHSRRLFLYRGCFY